MKISNQIWVALFAVLLLTPLSKVAAGSDSELKTFLYSIEGTYGWKPVVGDNMYDFFKDGRLHVQGNDGEATMWEGKWMLKGDQLTIKVPALKTDLTVTASIDGTDLLLGDERYVRHKP